MIFMLKDEPFEGFATIRDAFVPHEIDIIRNLIEAHAEEKTKAKVGPGLGDGTGTENKEIRDSYIKWLMYAPEYHWIYCKLANVINEFNPKFFGMDLKETEPIQLTEYDSVYQGFYGQHTDSSYNNDSKYRKLSVTMQLSDPKDYEGGDLRLYTNNFKEPSTACREKGAITLFRSHIIHEVMPVTKGKRYSFVTWVRGPLFK